MRLIFLGSGEFGLPTLRELCQQHQVLAVVSQPDRPSGRRRQSTPTPVSSWAQQAGLELFKVADVNESACVDRLGALKPDAAVVIAFGQKLGPALIGAMGRLAVNLHASLLPKYRGAAPINWAIINGEVQTGISVIGLAARMDAGLVYGQAETPIDPLETAGQLHDRLAQMGPALVGQVLHDFEAGTLQGLVQNELLATRAPKLTKADGTVRFDAMAQDVRNRVHGLTPWPGARVVWVQGQGAQVVRRPLILRRVAAEPDLSCFIGLNRGVDQQPAPGTILAGHRVAVRDGVVRLLEVQAPGGRLMSVADFARGQSINEGDRLEPVQDDEA